MTADESGPITLDDARAKVRALRRTADALVEQVRAQRDELHALVTKAQELTVDVAMLERRLGATGG